VQQLVLCFEDKEAPKPYKEWIVTFEGIDTNHEKIKQWFVDAIHTAVSPVYKAHHPLNKVYEILSGLID
jgi:hypothetical protein